MEGFEPSSKKPLIRPSFTRLVPFSNWTKYLIL